MYDTRLMENSMGDNGVEYINDLELHESPKDLMFVGLIVTSSITIDTIAVEDNTGNDMDGAVLPEGLYPFRFKNIKLAGGEAIAIKGA